MVNISSWNMRGINDPCKEKECRRFIQQKKIDAIVVLETRVK